MALLTASDAALFLGVDRRSLGRKRDLLAQHGLVTQVGRRWRFESQGLREAWLEVAHCQIGNTATLTRLAGEVRDGSRDEYAARTQQFWSEFGRWAPCQQLNEAEAWEHVVRMASALVGVSLTVQQVDELLHHLEEAAEDVRLGARWDAAAWASASARLESE